MELSQGGAKGTAPSIDFTGAVNWTNASVPGCIPPQNASLFISGITVSVTSLLIAIVMLIFLNWKNVRMLSISYWVSALLSCFIVWIIMSVLENLASVDICWFTRFFNVFCNVWLLFIHAGMAWEKYLLTAHNRSMNMTRFIKKYLALSMVGSLAVAGGNTALMALNGPTLSPGYGTYMCWTSVSYKTEIIHYLCMLVTFLGLTVVTLYFQIRAILAICKTRLAKRKKILCHMTTICVTYALSYVFLGIPGMVYRLMIASSFNCRSASMVRYSPLFYVLPVFIVVGIIIWSSSYVQQTLKMNFRDVTQGRSKTHRRGSSADNHHCSTPNLRLSFRRV